MTTVDHPRITPHHVVLIDFDWQDADLLPELLRTPGVTIGLVAGADPADAGLRVAALYGLPRSLELADLTREIFDLALVGARSPRREQLDRLLHALGTHVERPHGFVGHGSAIERRVPDAAPTTRESAEPEPDPGSRDFARRRDEESGAPIADPEKIPGFSQVLAGPDDPLGLERALAGWIVATSASAASLHLASGERLTQLCRSGPEDPLLDAIVAIAFRLDSPHVLMREEGALRGRLWAAWPFRTPLHRAVLAVAGADAVAGRQVLETAVRALVAAWRVAERGGEPEPPRLTPLTPEAFSARMRAAIDRHRTEGFHFALHRLTFDAPEDAVTALLKELPDRMRGTDCVCRPAPQDLLLLCAGTPWAYARLRGRIELLWRHAWEVNVGASQPTAIADERVDLAGIDEPQEVFVAPHDSPADR